MIIKRKLLKKMIDKGVFKCLDIKSTNIIGNNFFSETFILENIKE